MANHPSAEKRNRQRITRTERNRAGKSKLRTAVKKARLAVTSSPADAKALVHDASQSLDRAASKGVIPTKRASRLKSRLARALNKAAAVTS